MVSKLHYHFLGTYISLKLNSKTKNQFFDNWMILIVSAWYLVKSRVDAI